MRSKHPPHSPFAAMSRRAPSVMFAVVPGRYSPEIGCKCGSIHTLLQTSDRRLAVMSLMETLPWGMIIRVRQRTFFRIHS